ncbi:glycoside hydrolase family 15 protein [Patescibacteria group bacterium]|nr:MAG: glycoside hydrolase family 15 protein [Patescibacteria group bacterium]
MSRSLALGNGNILLLFDHSAQLRDFYFPYAGLENHIGSGNVHKIGVWVEGEFSWLSEPDWEITVAYERETMAGRSSARNERLALELEFLDIVYNEKNIFLRTVTVRNRGEKKREIRLFLNQQFQISETTHADTVYYNPTVHALIHYKGRRVFLVSGQHKGKLFSDYSAGIFKIEGREGTWKDAEDGVLSQNPIEHGSVDSTLGFSLECPAGGSERVYYWVTVAETFHEAAALQEYLLEKTPDHLAQTTQDFWRAWVNKYKFTFYGLDPKVVDVFKQSLFIVRTHCDSRGGILASGDSDNFRYGRDTYAYVWPRDGAFVALALDRCGYFDVSHRFYEFCSEVVTEEGYLLHKYQPDKSFGSSWHPWVKNGRSQLAIQEDETALLLFGLWEHYQKNRDLEFIESIYNSFIKRSADFMMRYREGFVTNLPFESYDVWEERIGISTFTASSVYGALSAASSFAALLGKGEEAARYNGEAEKIKEAILTFLYSPKTQSFLKLITVEQGATKADSTLDASSFYGIFRFGVLPPSDPRLVEAGRVLEERLHRPIPAGGYARYEGDRYYEVTPDVPGNPWFITTLWMIQYRIARAQTEEELRSINGELSWVVDHAQASDILSEQIHPLTGEQLSVSPLSWSHAEFVLSVIEYLEKLEELGICSVCYPLKRI